MPVQTRTDEIGCSFDLAEHAVPSAPKRSAGADDAHITAALHVTPPADSNGSGGRRPCDICCVVDTSGSMGAVAPASDGGEGDCLTRLDLVKHSLQTVIAVMKPQDRLGIVTFDSTASVASELCHVDGRGRSCAIDGLKDTVDGLREGGCTNLWDGLRMGLRLLDRGQKEGEGRIRSIMLLTDGEPSDKDQLRKLKEYRREHPGDATIINTFGFTYSLDSKLLEQIAAEGRGMYTFVPDASFVGTAFVNNLANTLSTMAHRTVVTVDLADGVELAGCPHGSRRVTLDLGPMMYGQRRSAVLKLRASVDVAIAAGYNNRRVMADNHHENDEYAAKVVKDDLL